MDNETKISLQFNNGVNGTKKLEEYTKQLEKIYALTSALNSDKASKTLGEINSTIKATEQNTKDLKTKSKDLSKVFATAFSIGKVVAFAKSIQRVGYTIAKVVQSSSSYIENVNLLEVAYKNANETIEQSSLRIERFIDKMADLYGLDESNLTRQFGVFKQMANAMQLPTETAENLSEILVKMTNDVASLYNLDLNRASNALQSALTGQTRPIRGATGADITEKTLQNTVEALELDRNISQLSYVEKRLVMIISLTQQLKQSQGDYARTIESTSNQFRILKEQWSRLTRSVGNVFYNLLGGILPYLNGILMALTEIFNLIASLTGFEMPEFDYSNLTGVSDVALDIEEGLDGAGESADNLKNKLSGLRGFDKLNVITTPQSSSSSAGSGIGASIDPKIMDAFNKAFADYDDMMDSVKMKARDIRDSIMQWLGFTKEINPITGEVSWKYQGIGKTLSNIWESFKNLSPEMKTISTIIAGIIGYKIGSKIVGLTGNLKELTGWTNSAGETLKGFSMANIDYWHQNATGVQKFTTALIGTGGVIAGLTMVSNAMEDISEQGFTLGNSLEMFGGGLSSILGGTMIGASIGGGAGAVAGGILGGVGALITALISYKDENEITAKKIIEDNKKIETSLDNLLGKHQNLANEMNSINTYSGKYKALADELVNITEKNGKVKEGYKTRAEFIINELSKAYGIEITITDDIIDNYDTIIQKIYDTIEAKRKELALQKAEEMYNQAVKEREELEKNYRQAKLDSAKAEIEYRNELIKNADYIGLTTEELQKYIEGELSYNDISNKITTEGAVRLGKRKTGLKNLKTALDVTRETEDKYSEAVANNSKVQSDYYKLHESIIEKDEQNTQYYLQDMTDNYNAMAGNINLSYADRIRYAEEYNRRAIQDAKERGEELYYIDEDGQKKINAMLKGQLDDNYAEIKTFMTNQLSYVKGVTPEIAEAWGTLGNTNKDRFLEYFATLPKDIQQDVVSKMYSLGYSVSDELQKGINGLNPTIKFQADLSGAEALVNRTINTWKNMPVFGNIFTNIFGKQDGGIFYNGGWHDIAKYDDGGLPPVGQMFVARENGAELVGNINNHTAVMNNDQIVDSVSDGVYRAVVNANGTNRQAPTSVTIPVQIGTKEIGKIVIKDLQQMAKANGKPIVIGG